MKCVYRRHIKYKLVWSQNFHIGQALVKKQSELAHINCIQQIPLNKKWSVFAIEGQL